MLVAQAEGIGQVAEGRAEILAVRDCLGNEARFDGYSVLIPAATSQ